MEQEENPAPPVVAGGISVDPELHTFTWLSSAITVGNRSVSGVEAVENRTVLHMDPGNEPISPVDDVIQDPNFRTTPEDRARFRTTFIEHAGPYAENNKRRFDQYSESIEEIKLSQSSALAWLSDIPTEDLVAVRGYTAGDFRKLNPPLRQLTLPEKWGNPIDDKEGSLEQLRIFSSYIKAVQSGLNQIPPFRGTVYRGIDLPGDKLLKQYVEGEVVTIKFFESTSSDLQRARRANVRMVIRSKMGRDVSAIAVLAREKEVLFSPPTRFKVVKVELNPAKGSDRYEREFEIVLEEI